MILTKDVSISQVSFIMSLGLVFRGLSTLFLFPYLATRVSSKTVLHVAGIGSLIAFLFYIPSTTFFELLLVTVLVHVFYPALMPALESIASILVQNNLLKHYGKSRQWGSIGFISIGIFITFFTNLYGDDLLYWVLLTGLAGFVALSFMKTPAILSAPPVRDKTQKINQFQLFRIKSFGLVLLIVILIQASHATYYNYGYVYLQTLEVPLYLIGLIINLAVIAEIIFFSLADKRFKHVSVGTLLALAAGGASLRWILIFSFPSIIIFSIAQGLHSFSFAMVHFAFLKYLIKHVPQIHIPKAQGLYSALALSWSTAVFIIFGGFLYEIEPRFAFIGMLVASIPALVLALFYRMIEQKERL